jgi:hypothetical protein
LEIAFASITSRADSVPRSASGYPRVRRGREFFALATFGAHRHQLAAAAFVARAAGGDAARSQCSSAFSCVFRPRSVARIFLFDAIGPFFEMRGSRG